MARYRAGQGHQPFHPAGQLGHQQPDSDRPRQQVQGQRGPVDPVSEESPGTSGTT